MVGWGSTESEHRSFPDVRVEPMDVLFSGYDMSYDPHVPDWGNDVGLEVIE